MKNFLFAIIAILGCGDVLAQTEISGSVKDEAGVPILGTNVIIVGTTEGTTTDFDGLYTIENLEPGTYTLEFSFVGYETLDKEVIIKAGETITVNASIGASAAALEEVIVKGTSTTKESVQALLFTGSR